MQKEKVREVVERLPDEFDVDAFFDQVILLERIEAAERRLANGEGVSHDDAKNRMEKWLK
ncbi:MAG: hypothetical protein ACR2FY_22895 [Pirellulaceae bacterium]